MVGTWGPEFSKPLVHMQRKPLNCPRLLGQFWGLTCAGYSPVSFAQQVEGALEMRPGGVLVAQGLFVIPMDCSLPGSLSVGFSRQEYWSGSPFPSAGDLPQSGIKPKSSALQVDYLPSEPLGKALYINSFLALCECVCVCLSSCWGFSLVGEEGTAGTGWGGGCVCGAIL